MSGRIPSLILCAIKLSHGSSQGSAQPSREFSPSLFEKKIQAIVVALAMHQGSIKGIRREEYVKHVAAILHLVLQPFIVSFNTQPIFPLGKPELSLQGYVIGILRTMVRIGSKPEFRRKSC